MSDNLPVEKNIEQPVKAAPQKRKSFFSNRKVNLAEVREAKKLVAAMEAGEPRVRRFSALAIFQHSILLLSVLTLLVTGLSQTFDNNSLVVSFIKLVGGMDRLQLVHRIAANLLMALMIIHIFIVMDAIFARMTPATMFFDKTDFRGLGSMIRLFTNRNSEAPEFGRYKPDEKFMYWLTVFSVGVSVLTGLFMLFPTQATYFLPGSVLPIANSIHRWQAILLGAVLITLHTYQVARKKGRVSIFTGEISVSEMKYEHPLEVRWAKRLAQLSEDLHFPILFVEHDLESAAVKPELEVEESVTIEIPAEAPESPAEALTTAEEPVANLADELKDEDPNQETIVDPVTDDVEETAENSEDDAVKPKDAASGDVETLE